MIFRTLKRLIERGATDGIEDKINVFYSTGRLTAEEHVELLAMLHREDD